MTLFGATLQTSDLVFWSAVLGTFVASVMAEDQSERLQKGLFGAIAGASLGGLAALISQDNQLLLVGVLGSSVGAAAGWLAYMALSFVAATRWGERLVEYQVKGLAGVRERQEYKGRAVLLNALNSWSEHFSRLVVQDRNFLWNLQSSEQTNQIIRNTLRNWMATATDTLNLVLHTFGEKELLRSRSTIIAFDDQGEGHHWISYAGGLQDFKSQPFPKGSIAYRVAQRDLATPYFVKIDDVNEGKIGTVRETDGARLATPRVREGPYKAFIVFRLTDHAVLSVDWPGSEDESDPYVERIRNLYQLNVCPAMQDALKRWYGDFRDQEGRVPVRTPPDGDGAAGVRPQTIDHDARSTH